jgi:hypothetical protein
VSRVATLPPDAGILARYEASIDDVARVVPGALDAVGQSVVERDRPDSSSIAWLGMRGLDLWSYGEVSRTLARRNSQGGSDVRVVVRPRDVFDFWPSTSSSLLLVSEIDRRLGPAAITLAAGDHIRGRSGAGQMAEGTLLMAGPGRFLLRPDGGEAVPLDALGELEIRRGSYRHTRTGGAIGAGVGSAMWLGALGFCLGRQGETSQPSWCESSAVNLVPVIGAVVGALIGSTVLSSVWSPVS